MTNKADQLTVEESFRSSLRDAIALMEKLAPDCSSVQEMIEMAQLALKNDGQLNMLLNRVAPIRLKQ